MGSGVSSNAQGKIEYITKLEAEVQKLKSLADEATKRAGIVQTEKETIQLQSVKQRTLASQIKKTLAVFEEESAVNNAQLEEKLAQARANEEAAMTQLAEVRSELELIKLEVTAGKLRHQAEMKEMERDLHRIKIEHHEKLERLIANYDSLVQQLVDNGRIVRAKALDFLTHVVDLADNFKLKQIKADTEENIAARKRELNRFNAKKLEAHVFPAKEFLLLSDGGFRFRQQKEKAPTTGDEIAMVDLELPSIPQLSTLQEQDAYRKDVIGDVADALQIDHACVGVIDVSENAVRVSVKKDKADPENRSAQQLAEELIGQVFATDSSIRQGLTTNKVESASFVHQEQKMIRRRKKKEAKSPSVDSPTVESSPKDQSPKPNVTMAELVLFPPPKEASSPTSASTIDNNTASVSKLVSERPSAIDIGQSPAASPLTTSSLDPKKAFDALLQFDDRSPTMHTISEHSGDSLADEPPSATALVSRQKRVDEYVLVTPTLNQLTTPLSKSATPGSVQRPVIELDDTPATKTPATAKTTKQARLYATESVIEETTISVNNDTNNDNSIAPSPSMFDNLTSLNPVSALDFTEFNTPAVPTALSPNAAPSQWATPRRSRAPTPRIPDADDKEMEERMNEEKYLDIANKGLGSAVQDVEAMSPQFEECEAHIRLFVFGTYRDMQEERDQCHRLMYHDLETVCAELGMAFTPIDLFWGIIADAKKAETSDLLTCFLNEIERCTHFSFFVGGKYGWVPSAEMVYPEAKKRPWLSKFRQERQYHASILEMLWTQAHSSQRPLYVFSRSTAYSDNFPSDLQRHFRETNVDRASRMNELRHYLKNFSTVYDEDYSGPPVAVRSLNKLMRKCVDEVNKNESLDKLELKRDLKAHSAYGFAHTTHPIFVGFWRYSARIRSHLDPANLITIPLVIEGDAGTGKTALVSHVRTVFRGLLPNALWITYFVGCTSDSFRYERVCQHIIAVIKERYGFEEDVPTAAGAAQWARHLLVWLGMASSRGGLVLTIDGIDAVENDESGVEWLPDRFPRESRIILTSRSGTALDAMRQRSWGEMSMLPMDDDMLEELCGVHIVAKQMKISTEAPSLPKDLPRQVLSYSRSKNPLFVRVALEEVLNSHELAPKENVSETTDQVKQMQRFQPVDIIALLDFVLWEWETRFALHCPGMARSVLTALVCSRWGLSQYELLELFPDISAVALEIFLDHIVYYTVTHAGYINIAHPAFRNAITQRYLPSFTEKCLMHRKLAIFFEEKGNTKRSLEEQPWQWLMSEAWKELLQYISNMEVFTLLFRSSFGRDDLCRYWLCTDDHLDVVQAFTANRAKLEQSQVSLTHLMKVTQLLTVFFEELGEPDQAVIMCRQVQDMAKSTGEKDEQGLAAICERLAKLLCITWDAGNKDFSLLEEARDNYQNALNVWNETLDPLKMDLENAVALGDAAWKDAQAKYNATAVHIGDLKAALAGICLRQGDFEQSEMLYQEAIDCHITFLYSNHAKVASTAVGMAELWIKRHNYHKAETFARRAVMIRQIAFGWNHPEFANALKLLARILDAEGEVFESNSLEKRAIKIMAAFPQTETQTVQEHRVKKRTVQKTIGQGGSGSILKPSKY